MTPSQSTWDTCCNIFKWISVGTADLQCGYSQVFPRECWEQQGRAAPRVRWQSDGLYPRCYNRLSGSRGRLLRRDLTNRNSGGPDSEWEGWWMDSVVQELLCKADSASLREGENVMRASCVPQPIDTGKKINEGIFWKHAAPHWLLQRPHLLWGAEKTLSGPVLGFGFRRDVVRSHFFNRQNTHKSH